MCDGIWERGFPVEKMTAKEAVNVKKSFNCKVQTQDGAKYVLIELPKEDRVYETFVQAIRLYTDVASLPNGLYTWIFPSPTTIALTPVLSAIEAGSAHMTIAYRVGADKIHGAGELKKQGNTVTYNLLSGTYMLKWLDSVEECREPLESTIRAAFERMVPGAVFVDTTMIVKDTRITTADLDWYSTQGFSVRLFDDAKTCVAARDEEYNRIVAEIQAAQKARVESMLAAKKRGGSRTTKGRCSRRKTKRRKM